VTQIIQQVAEVFHCTPLEAVLSHQLKRFVIDGNKVIINKPALDQKVEEFSFEENEVYAIDIVMSTGEGKVKEMEAKTTIYKRVLDHSYLLKLKAARYVFNEISHRFQTFPFTIRALDESRAKFGVVECLNHGLVQPYPVLFEKSGEFIAQFKFTVFVLPSSTQRMNTFELPFVSSQYSITDPQLVATLNSSTKKTSNKNKNKKKKKKSTANASAASSSTSSSTSSSNSVESKTEANEVTPMSIDS